MESNPTKIQRLRSGLIGMVLNRGVMFIASFIGSVILARWLGPGGRGEYGIYTTTVMTLVVVLNLGLAAANTVIVGRKPSSYQQLITNTIVFSVIISVPILFLPRLLSYETLTAITQMPPDYWLFASVNLWLNMTFLSLNGILLGQQDYKAYNGITLFQAILNLSATIIALIILRSGVVGLIISGIFVSFAVLIATLVTFARKNGATSLLGTLNWKLFRETLPVGMRATIIAVLETLHFRIDLLLLGFWTNTESVGIYALAVYIANIIMFLPPLLNYMIFSQVPSSGVQGAKIIIQLSYMVMIIPLLGIIAVLIAGRPFIAWVYTPQFLPAYIPLLVLLVAEIPKAQVAITAGFLAGIGYPVICIVGAFVGLVINILMNIWLIPVMAETGAAIASAVSYTIFSLIYLMGIYRHGQLALADLRPSFSLMRQNMIRFIQLRKVNVE